MIYIILMGQCVGKVIQGVFLDMSFLPLFTKLVLQSDKHTKVNFLSNRLVGPFADIGITSLRTIQS